MKTISAFAVGALAALALDAWVVPLRLPLQVSQPEALRLGVIVPASEIPLSCSGCHAPRQSALRTDI